MTFSREAAGFHPGRLVFVVDVARSMANPLPCKLCPILRLSIWHTHHSDPASVSPRAPGHTMCGVCKNFKIRYKDETARLLPEATTAVPKADAEARATAAEARATAAETRATAAEAKATAAETRATAAEALTEARATDAEAEARATAAETKATAAEAKATAAETRATAAEAIATAAEIRATTAETERAKALREHKKMFDDLQAHFKRSKEREAARKTSAQVLVDAPAATVDPADSTRVEAAPAAHPRKYNRDLDSVKSQTPEGMVCRVNPEGLPRYWALDQILDSRWKQGTDQKEYLCKWFGYDENEATWHDADELFKCSIKIHHYETKGMQTGSKRSIGEIASSSSDATTAPTTGSSSIDDPTAQVPQAQAPFKAPRRIN